MPIYEYQCSACGHHLEAMQKFSDQPLTDCPECHKQTLQKQISSSAFHLKGGGWYVTDIRDKGKSKPAQDNAVETAKPEKSDSADKKSDGSSSNSTDTSAE